MSVIKTYKGSEINLKHYQGQSIVGQWFDLFEDDDSSVDMSQYSSVKFQIYAKRNGTLLKTCDNSSGLTISGSRVTLDISKLYMSIYRVGLTYYHHMIGVRKTTQPNETEETDLIFFGNSEML